MVPAEADVVCGYDTVTPDSEVNLVSPYWMNSITTITVTSTDSFSGVNNITLYHRFSDDNVTWEGWISEGTDTVLPWSWNVAFLNGTGFYQFYSIAIDHATNNESIPGGVDAWCGYDNQIPTSSVNTITEYWKTSAPVLIMSTINDTGSSGLKNTSLYYRYRPTNSTGWGSYICFGIDTTPWTNCSWAFTFPNGPGHYQLYSIATDNATNTETAPGGNGDTSCGYNTGTPLSFVIQVIPYWTSTEPLLVTATAEDFGPSGLKNVTLYFYNSIDNITWSGPWSYGVDIDPWISCSWSFSFPNQTRYYRFYACAADNSNHVETAPLINDTECGYDIQSPVCSISYNTSVDSFKSSDSLKIYANFTEPYSGMDESSVRIAISTNGDDDVVNTSMIMIENTHWFYNWTIPSGSDEDGQFTVSIYAQDTVSNHLSPYPTTDASKQIDNTPPILSNLGVDNFTSSSVRVTWLTNENATSQIEYGPALSFGSWFNSSSSVLVHQCVLSGLSSGMTYYYRVVSYDPAGNQATSINESFTTLTQPSRKRAPVQIIENTPPSNPFIEGPTTGHIDVSYSFIVGSIDPNNDSISYSFDWGDGTIESSGYLPNEIHCIKNHSWTQAGRYTITLKASDTKSSTSSETTIWIDTIIVGDKGYLLDFDCDGLFDIFHNGLTGLETETQMRDGNYLIDIDGDSSWDYQFNATSGVILLMLHQPPSSEEGSSPLLLINGLILVVLLGLFIILYRRRHHKQQ
jgi:hypothetical protein